MSDAQLNDHGSIPVNIKNKNRQCKYFSMSSFLSSPSSLLSYSFRHQHYGMNQIRHHFLSDPVRHQHYGQEPGTSLLSDSTRQHYGQKPGHFDHHYCPILTVVNIIRDPRWGSSLVSHHCCLLLFVIKKH